MKKMLGCILLSVATCSAALAAAEGTALALIKAGNRFIGEQSKNKVISVRSEKSVGGVMPDVWYVLYRDSETTFKYVEVKFSRGRKLLVTRPWRLLSSTVGDNKLMDVGQLKVDSDQAIGIALAQPALQGLTPRAVQLELVRSEAGFAVWKVNVWVLRMREVSEDVLLGQVVLSAADGKVLESSLKPGRAR